MPKAGGAIAPGLQHVFQSPIPPQKPNNVVVKTVVPKAAITIQLRVRGTDGKLVLSAPVKIARLIQNLPQAKTVDVIIAELTAAV